VPREQREIASLTLCLSQDQLLSLKQRLEQAAPRAAPGIHRRPGRAPRVAAQLPALSAYGRGEMTMQLPRLALETCALTLSLLAGALSACVDGTSTGNPNNGGPGVGEETGGGYCKKLDSGTSRRTRRRSWLSAGEVLAFVEGTHEETLTWYPQSIASYGPESGSQALTLVITRKGSPRLTHYGPDTGGAEIGTDCGPAIEVDVDVTLTTAQGALDERLSGTLQIKSALTASLFLRPDPNKLGGSFHITEVHTPGFKLVQLFLNITFTKFRHAGQLQPTFEMRSNDAVGASAGGRDPLAAWGPPACEGGKRAVPRGEKVAGFSADEVIALLDDTQGASIAFARQFALRADLGAVRAAGQRVRVRAARGAPCSTRARRSAHFRSVARWA
jgi:hypothetical protein